MGATQAVGVAGGGGGGKGPEVRSTPTHSSTGSKINILNKHPDFLLSTTFKLSSQVPGNSINNSDFFLVYNFCCGRPV